MMLIGTQPRMHFSHGPVPRRHALMQWKQSRSTVSWMTARSRGSRGAARLCCACADPAATAATAAAPPRERQHN